MSTEHLHQVVACAQDIIKAVGPCDNDSRKICASGRHPLLPPFAMNDLVDIAVLQRLPYPTESQLSRSVMRTLLSVRQASMREFDRVMTRLYSPQRYGIKDDEVEDRVIQMIETSYNQRVQSVRELLARALRRNVPNEPLPRGGFGDVSPSIPKLTPKLTLQHNRTILETAYSHTSSPTSPEVDHLSRLTGLEPHQVSPHPSAYLHTTIRLLS